MKVGQFLIVLTVLLIGFPAILSADNEDTDYAIPAISDLPMLGIPNSNPQMLAGSLKEDINPFPVAEQIR